MSKLPPIARIVVMPTPLPRRMTQVGSSIVALVLVDAGVEIRRAARRHNGVDGPPGWRFGVLVAHCRRRARTSSRTLVPR